jgi:hypothetical protein
VERYWDGLLEHRLWHSEWGHVSGSEGFAQSTFGRVDGYLNRYRFGYRSACETNFLPLASLDQRNVAGNGPT